jgi:hypothetical protein
MADTWNCQKRYVIVDPKSSAKTESLFNMIIDSKNRVMGDAWNCQKHYVTADP